MRLKTVSDNQTLLKIRAEGVILPGGLVSDECPMTDAFGTEVFKRQVVINFEQVETVNSAGIGWLINLHRTFEKAGGAVAVYCIPAMVRQTFRLVSLQRTIRVADDEASAIKMLEDKPA